MSKLLKDKGIVVRTFKYGETSVILDILTEVHGLGSFILQGVRKSKSRTSPSSIQLAASVDLDFYMKENTDLHQLKELKVNTIRTSIYSDIRKIALCMFLSELTRRMLNKYENHQLEFSLLQSVLDDLEANDDNWSIHIWYLIRLLEISGFSLLKHRVHPEYYYDIPSDTITSNRPLHHSYLSGYDMITLTQLNQADVRQVSQFKPKRDERNRLVEKLLDFLKVHIPGFQHIQSFDVLKYVFE